MTSADGRAPLATDSFHVVMGDTDAAGVIYFAAPFHWAERLTNTWMQSAGLPLSRMLNDGFGLPAVRAEASYHHPLRLDDVVEASLWLQKRTTRSAAFRSEFRRAGHDIAVVVLLTQVFVMDGEDGMTAVPLPPAFVAAAGEAIERDRAVSATRAGLGPDRPTCRPSPFW
jgi:YbgC/YbaW family acyl-CoA thioester hydrolase